MSFEKMKLNNYILILRRLYAYKWLGLISALFLGVVFYPPEKFNPCGFGEGPPWLVSQTVPHNSSLHVAYGK